MDWVLVRVAERPELPHAHLIFPWISMKGIPVPWRPETAPPGERFPISEDEALGLIHVLYEAGGLLPDAQFAQNRIGFVRPPNIELARTLLDSPGASLAEVRRALGGV